MRVRNLKTTMLGVLCVGAIACPAFGDPYDYTWDHPCPEQPLHCYWHEPPCWCQGEWDNQDHWLSNPDGYPSDPSDTAMIEHSNTGHCNGGFNDGDECNDNLECHGTCDGGLNHGDECNDDVECPGTCDRGCRAGQACNSDSNCLGACHHGPMHGECCRYVCIYPGICGSAGTCQNKGTCENVGTCQNYEDYLKVDVANETIAYLLIRTKDSSASDDSLEVWFNNIGWCSGSHEPCESRFDCPFMQLCVGVVKTLTVGAFVIHAENGPATFKINDATIKTDPTD